MDMSKIIADLCWGESVCVRQAFIEQTSGRPIQFGWEELEEMNYTPFNGDPVLIVETAKVILRQTGMTYKHVFLTNGATGGCTIALRACAISGNMVAAVTNSPPYFPLYPGMALAAGLRHITTEKEFNDMRGWETVFLLDTPANPSGLHAGLPEWYKGGGFVIWDAVYHNWVYSSILPPAPEHDIAVGSFSKLTGLNGIRIGWIATNNDWVAERVAKLIAAEYCGLSRPSKVILLSLLDQYNVEPEHRWGAFEKAARYNLDFNRGEWAKLERYFGGTPVPVNGMFFYSEMDESAKRLFEKAGVLYQLGSKCGTSDDFGRFNLGQDCALVQNAVKAVLKQDKI